MHRNTLESPNEPPPQAEPGVERSREVQQLADQFLYESLPPSRKDDRIERAFIRATQASETFPVTRPSITFAEPDSVASPVTPQKEDPGPPETSGQPQKSMARPPAHADARRDVGAPAPPIMLSDLQRQLLEIITSEEDRIKSLSRIMHLLLRGTAADALILFRRDALGQLVAGPRLHRKWLSLSEPLVEKLAAWCQQSCRENRAQTHAVDDAGKLTAVALPVAMSGTHAESLCAVLRTSESLNYSVAILHVASAYLSMWHVRRDAARADSEADNAAALVEIVSRLQACDQVQDACRQLVQDMQEHLACQRVAIGLRSRNTLRCRLQAISGLAEFDHRAELVRLVEAAMQEAIVRDQLTVWPASTERTPATLAHKKLARIADVFTLVTGPLKDVHGELIGAWLFMGDEGLARDTKRHHRIRATTPHVASCLQLVRRNQRGRLSRLADKIWSNRQSWQFRAAMVSLVALGGLLLLPFPYQITCDMRLQPVARRFVAAPFPATVKRTLCEPGQVVAKNQLLAQLDGRETRWKLAGLLAEHQRADKERQVAVATHDTATVQQVELRMQRLALRIRLLKHRSEHLDIRSPIDGMVLRGDLKDAVGVPVTTGQTLFEVAPLHEMVAEIAIPDEEIRHVREGCQVTLRLDAEPGRERQQTLGQVDPAAEMVDGQNVFVGQVQLDNSDNMLRPGMAGRATISGPRRPLVWNLFHRPWYYLIRILGV